VHGDNPLRWPDEFVRHKIGDVVGDLLLTGGRVRAHVVAERPSHAGNVALAEQIVRAVGAEPARPIVDITQIMQYLPHRYPMLLVDRIVEFEAGKRIVGIKNVTINEPFFQGHYPGHPIMPGVLIIEAMAQVGGLLLMEALDDPEGKVVYFMSLDNVKWRRPVTPGDQIRFELEMLQLRRSVCRMKGVGYVDGQIVAEAEMMAGIRDR
jgi:UDP-3-O-[3-hydroxymyristoyl] N-acetylglucosamine deacetylase/3-hydroxyacyl-[acyl-carrier-protein] dehydratase